MKGSLPTYLSFTRLWIKRTVHQRELTCTNLCLEFLRFDRNLPHIPRTLVDSGAKATCFSISLETPSHAR